MTLVDLLIKAAEANSVQVPATGFLGLRNAVKKRPSNTVLPWTAGRKVPFPKMSFFDANAFGRGSFGNMLSGSVDMLKARQAVRAAAPAQRARAPLNQIYEMSPAKRYAWSLGNTLQFTPQSRLASMAATAGAGGGINAVVGGPGPFETAWDAVKAPFQIMRDLHRASANDVNTISRYRERGMNQQGAAAYPQYASWFNKQRAV